MKWYTEEWSNHCKFSISYNEQLHSETSEFQQIDFYKGDEFGTFFTLDGLMMVNEKDEFVYHDMITHPAFATNPNIKNVLIIGGGDGGTAREVLRYKSVEKVWCDIVSFRQFIAISEIFKNHFFFSPEVFIHTLIKNIDAILNDIFGVCELFCDRVCSEFCSVSFYAVI